MFGKTVHTFDATKKLMERDLGERFPNISRSIASIDIKRSSEAPLSGDIRSAGIFVNTDSKVCNKEAGAGKPAMRVVITDEVKSYIDKEMDSLVQKGYSEEDAHRKVQDSLTPMMGYDAAKREYVMAMATPKAVAEGKARDSLLQQTSIPMWNVGFLTKIIKQPFATSHAKNLVSVESFGNPWADVVALFKESFEGYGKLSNVARGNFKQNNSNPVTNEAAQIVDEIFNISVDYESDIMEDIKANQAGNFLTGQIRADREKYAMMVLDRMQDALIYYGSKEAGIDGLVDVATVEVYTGTPLNDIINDASETNPGAKIVLAMNKLIGDFLRESHYMARKVRINVSEYVFQALTQTVYSDTYNPNSPLKVLRDNFIVQNELDGGSMSVAYEIVSDTMLNPNTPFNPDSSDMMFLTIPALNDALSGMQDSLIIHPELIKSYIVPPIWQRSGLLYTMYKRIGGVIAPVQGTVKVVKGFGYQED